MKVFATGKKNYRQFLFLAVGLSIFTNGCTPSQITQNTTSSSSFLAKDVTSCRQKANILIDRDLRNDRSYDRSGADSLEISFAYFDAHKQRSRYFRNCISKQTSKKISNYK